MGCDIHVHYEILDAADTNEWMEVTRMLHLKHYAYEDSWYTGRNYPLFGLLAGVRSGIEPIAEPRGLPANVSSTVKVKKGEWEHSASYYTLTEIREALRQHYISGGTMEEDESVNAAWSGLDRICAQMFDISYTVPALEKHKEWMDQIRIVFWFDS